MPNERPPELRGASAYTEALQDEAQGLLERYQDDPEGLAIRLGLSLPYKPVQVMYELGVYDAEKHGPITPGLRELVLDVCNLEEESAVAVGPRGGGKSQGVSFIEFYLWMLKSFDALNLGGSELQAAGVYNYLLGYLESDPEWMGHIKGDTKISETEKMNKAWIRVLTASSKSVRSPHAGGLRNVNGEIIERGGLLVIDEEAEADPEIVKAALPTIDTARPSINVRCSTFHNAEGTFAEVIENHDDMGYKLYQWDIFDIAEPCECPGTECEHEEVCFRQDHYMEVENQATGELERQLVHRAYCGGRSKYANGWMLQREITKLWKRMHRNHNLWEVEAMGSRPKSSGYVIKDLDAFDRNFTDLTAAEVYMHGAPVYILADWGAVNAAIEVWQRQWTPEGEKHALLHADPVEEAGLLQILGIILKYWTMYPEAQLVRADIGGGGSYLNPHLRENEGIPCEDVNFQVEKEAAVAVWNLFSEQRMLIIPREHDEYRRQVRKWKRKNGHINKGDDHLCDASVCYFAMFIEELGLTGIRIAPKTFDTSASGVPALEHGRSTQDTHVTINRVPVVRGIGAR